MDNIEQVVKDNYEVSEGRRVFVEERYVYVGEFKDESKHGRGVLVFKEEFVKKIVRVVGCWRDNKMDTSEMVQILYKNEDVFSGYVNQKIKRHGKGVLKKRDGTTYTGEFRNGKKEGRGKEISKDVTVLGEFSNDLKNGFGILEFHDDKTRIIGCWKKGVLKGYAVIHYGNGDRYEGEVRNGIITGKGVMKYSNGSVYNGGFLFNKKHGYGVLSSVSNLPIKKVEPKRLSTSLGRVISQLQQHQKMTSSSTSGSQQQQKKHNLSSAVKRNKKGRRRGGKKGFMRRRRKKSPLKKRCVYEGVFHHDDFQHGIMEMKNEYIMGSWGPNQLPTGDRIEHMLHDPKKQESTYYYGTFTPHGVPKDGSRKYKVDQKTRYIIQSRKNLDQVLTYNDGTNSEHYYYPNQNAFMDLYSLSSTNVSVVGAGSSSAMKSIMNSSAAASSSSSSSSSKGMGLSGNPSVNLSRRKFTRKQIFYYDTGVIRPLPDFKIDGGKKITTTTTQKIVPCNVVLDLNYANFNLNIYNAHKRNKNKQVTTNLEKLPTVQLRAEKVLWSSVQKWYYDGNTFRSYYDVKKYCLDVGDNTEWALVRSDLFPRKPIQGRKYLIQSCVSKEYLHVQKQQQQQKVVGQQNRKIISQYVLAIGKLQYYVQKKRMSFGVVVSSEKPEEEEEEGEEEGEEEEQEKKKKEMKIGRNYIWNFQHGQLVNWGSGKKLVLNEQSGLPDVKEIQILIPQKVVPEPTWLFDGSMIIHWKKSKCLCLGNRGNLTTMVWSSKKNNLSWNLINVV